MDKVRPESVILSIVLTSILNISFVTIFARTFSLPIDRWFLLILCCLMEVFLLLLVLRKRWIYGVAGISFLCLLLALFLATNMAGVMSALRDTYRRLDYMFNANSISNGSIASSRESFTILLTFVECIPTFFVIWAINRRHTVIPALISYLLLLVPVLMTNGSVTSPQYYVFAAVGVTLLIIYECLRRKEQKNVDFALIYISIPLLVICFVLGVAFYGKNYRMNEFATKQYFFFVDGVERTFGIDFDRVLVRTFNISKSRSIEDEDFIDLTEIGDNYNEKTPVLDVTLLLDSNEDIADYNQMYLKSSSYSIYEDNRWTSRVAPSAIDLYLEENKGADIETVGSLTVSTTRFEDAKKIVYSPSLLGDKYETYKSYLQEFAYPDLVTCDERNVLPVEDIYEWSIVKSNSYVKTPVWSEKYMDYVDECTMVPDETRERIIESGVLPDWYMGLLNGEVEMTMPEKIVSVMNYIYQTKTYSLSPRYSRTGEDFTSWFLSESNEGYCIHYATATAVLLRLLDIPTRYVNGYKIGTFGDPTSVNDDLMYYKTVLLTDSHAWCEVFDPQYGWIGIDPTSNMFINSIRNFENIEALVGSDEYEDRIGFESEQRAGIEIENEDEVVKVEKPLPLAGYELYIISGFVLVIILILSIMRLAYAIRCHNEFVRGDMNSRVRGYCRYLLRFAKRNSVQVPEDILYRTEIAMYSKNGVSEEDLLIVQKLAVEYVDSVLKSSSTLRRIVEMVVFSVPMS